MRRGLALVGLVLLAGCAAGPRSESAYIKQARNTGVPPSLARDLFQGATTDEEWNAAFAANPRDADLVEAYAYKQLLRGEPGGGVSDALVRAATLRPLDPWVYYLQARQRWLAQGRESVDETTAAEEHGASAFEYFKQAQEQDRHNAFAFYQEAAFQSQLGETGGALNLLNQGNALPEYRHPFGAPMPRDLTDLGQLIPGMGEYFWIYFSTHPRTFNGELNRELIRLAQGYAGDPVSLGRVRRAAARQLTMQPFDLNSFKDAVALNTNIWADAPDGAAVREALTALEEPLREVAIDTNALYKRLKEGGAQAQLEFGAAELARTKRLEQEWAPLRKRLNDALETALAAAS